MYELITLDQVKSWLSIENNTQDTFLNSMREIATGIIEKEIDKKVITRQINGELQDGKGQNNILTKFYPIYKIVNLYDDIQNDFESADEISSSNYSISNDTGQIKLINDEYVFIDAQNNVKINYWAGLSRFLIISSINNLIDIEDASGNIASIEIPISTVNQDGYSAEDLAVAIKTALNAESTITTTFTVSYSHEMQKFTITGDANFKILWHSGDSEGKNISNLIGFTNSADDEGAASYTADTAETGVPTDLVIAAAEMVDFLFDSSKAGFGIQNIKKKILAGGQGTLEYILDFPQVVKNILKKYKRVYL